MLCLQVFNEQKAWSFSWTARLYTCQTDSRFPLGVWTQHQANAWSSAWNISRAWKHQKIPMVWSRGSRKLVRGCSYRLLSFLRQWHREDIADDLPQPWPYSSGPMNVCARRNPSILSYASKQPVSQHKPWKRLYTDVCDESTQSARTSAQTSISSIGSGYIEAVYEVALAHIGSKLDYWR